MESRRAAVRRLLRAARAHDRTSPALKALLPLSSTAEFPLSDELAPPLLKLATEALRLNSLTRTTKVRFSCLLCEEVPHQTQHTGCARQYRYA